MDFSDKWIGSLGTASRFWIASQLFLIKFTGESFSVSSRNTSLEQRIQSLSEVGDASGITALLEKILVLEPTCRPDVSGILDDPWFGASSSPAAASGSGSE